MFIRSTSFFFFFFFVVMGKGREVPHFLVNLTRSLLQTIEVKMALL